MDTLYQVGYNVLLTTPIYLWYYQSSKRGLLKDYRGKVNENTAAAKQIEDIYLRYLRIVGRTWFTAGDRADFSFCGIRNQSQ